MVALTWAWAALKWLLSPVGRILAFVGMVLIAILTIFASGKRQGRQVERRKTEEAVQRVEREMRVETTRPRSVEETRKRLDRGDF